ncbi:MAG: LysR substrate-binding domain-containing protein [Pseudomonadota bacterium]
MVLLCRQRPVAGPLVSNSGEALRIAAVEGLGFVVLPRWLVLRDLEAGALLPCLPSYRVNIAGFSPTFYAVHARSAFVPAKIKVFVDFLVDRIGRRTA